MSPLSPLDALLRQARRRHLANTAAAAIAWVAAFSLAGLVLLLLIGTSVLSWRWVAAVCTAGLAWRLHQARKQKISDYSLAQRIDRRLHLRDALSTALYFRTAAASVSPEIRDAQRRQAESESRSLDARLAVPFRPPGALRVAVPLSFAALGLLALRYHVTGSLNLRPPLARIVLPASYGGHPEEIASNNRPAKVPNSLPAGALTIRDPGMSSLPGDEMAPSAPHGSGAADSESPAAPGSSRPQGQSAGEPADDRGVPPADGDSAGERPSEEAAASNLPANRPSPNEDSDLLNKLRDAMADLLAKLRIQPPVSEMREVASNSRGSPSGRSVRDPSRQAGSAGDRQAASASGPAQRGEQAESGEAAQGSQGQSGEQGAGRPDPNAQERSGMGKEEGGKDVKEAEQLAAMGKISEILSKRAQNLTGDIMVEVTSSGNQQLRTPYSRRKLLRSDAGGEIHRDEIPLVFQHFVQRYYEEVRKSPPALPALPAAAGPGR